LRLIIQWDNALLYVGIGTIAALAVAGVAAFLMLRKKK
jgi:hypothetical protein